MISKQNIPNQLTYARAGAVPVVLGLMLSGVGTYPLFAIFVAASITDFLDGYLARKWNCTSAIGAMLDPLADKLLVALMLLYLIGHTDAPLLPIATIILREIYISGLRETLALRNIPLPVSKGGKWKTAAQMAAITLLLASLSFSMAALWMPGIVLLWFSAALALWSAAAYSRAALVHLK